MSDNSPVVLERIDRVALLQLNRPEKDNTLTPELLEALIDTITEIKQDHYIRAVILCGSGDNFSLGGDFQEFKKVLSYDEHFGQKYCKSQTSALAEVISGIYELPYPVVAALHGQVAGAGLSLALACDFRIAEKRTRINVAYGTLGASTDGGMSWLLPKIVGSQIAVEILLEQPIIRANHALDIGLVSDIVPSPEELKVRSMAFASQLADNAVHSNIAAKRLVRLSDSRTLWEHMRDEHETFSQGFMTDEMRKAIEEKLSG